MRTKHGAADGLAVYDIQQTYAWNYAHAPDSLPEVDVPDLEGNWTYCGLSVPSPLGIAAGPLLNSRWCLYYAALGFDVVTYKTVRSVYRESYPLPNLQPVDCSEPMTGAETHVEAAPEMRGSWAVSFGMPSQTPDIWRADVELTRRELPAGKVLAVSVVGTVQPGWSLDELAEDYARCARWAVDSGADCIEANFSCPNVATCDGQVFQHPDQAAVIAQRIREEIGRKPLLVKLGHIVQRDATCALYDAVLPHVDGLTMTNSLATRVVEREGVELFDSQPRGICGEATRAASVAQVARFRALKERSDDGPALIGVGGVTNAHHVMEFLDAGADAVQVATAAMLDPLLAIKIRRDLLALQG